MGIFAGVAFSRISRSVIKSAAGVDALTWETAVSEVILPVASA
jgi:hypothetical protein